VNPPELDRTASRADLGVIASWRAEIDARYRALLAGSDASRPDDADAIREFESACRDDQEWAHGYEAGRVDADRIRKGSRPEGPGASWFGDGWSASRTRQTAYELALADGA
jgi:hypothetical protein